LNTKRTILFRLGAVAVLLIIAGIMMVIGRGHTVYLDNKTLDYKGQSYKAPYKVVVYVDGEEVAKLRSKERGMATCIGQKIDLVLEITREKGGSEETLPVTIALPYQMDGIAVNLPAYLEGLPEEAWLSEFIPAPVESEESEEPEGEIPTDEFGLETDI